jgi:hypothetical protein
MEKTLSDFRQFPGTVAVFAEYRGQRFFIHNSPSFTEATAGAEALKRAMPRASYFVTDVYNSTRVDGLASDLRNAYAQEKSE